MQYDYALVIHSCSIVISLYFFSLFLSVYPPPPPATTEPAAERLYFSYRRAVKTGF
jgi:hypothetical protein